MEEEGVKGELEVRVAGRVWQEAGGLVDAGIGRIGRQCAELMESMMEETASCSGMYPELYGSVPSESLEGKLKDHYETSYGN